MNKPRNEPGPCSYRIFLVWKGRGIALEERFDQQQLRAELDDLEDDLTADILEDVPKGELGVEDFDAEAYFSEDI